MSGKSQAGHVDLDNDPLPSPLTTRNLQPRLSRSLARAAYRDASRSQRLSSGPSSHRSITSVMSSTTGAPTSSSTSDVGSSSGNQTAESSSMAARTRKRQAKQRRVATPEDIDIGSTSDEVDQLISSDSDDIPVVQSVPKSHSQMDTQVTSGSSCSAGVAGPSSSARQRGLSYVPKSFPSPELKTSSSSPATAQVSGTHVSSGTSSPAPEPLADYTCPICFFAPTNATLTPCGHICCGACLFTAVKSALQRGTLVNNADANVARCPVCRAPIPGWDGRGGGVIGLKARSLLSL